MGDDQVVARVSEAQEDFEEALHEMHRWAPLGISLIGFVEAVEAFEVAIRKHERALSEARP